VSPEAAEYLSSEVDKLPGFRAAAVSWSAEHSKLVCDIRIDHGKLASMESHLAIRGMCNAIQDDMRRRFGVEVWLRLLAEGWE
jgi:hypothetical protein